MIRPIIYFFFFYTILNAQITVAQATATDSSKITNISLNSKGLLKWMVFIADSVSQQVESFENNEWKVIYSDKNTLLMTIGSIKQGRIKQSTRVKLHSGKNIFRIRVTSPYEEISKEIEFYKK